MEWSHKFQGNWSTIMQNNKSYNQFSVFIRVCEEDLKRFYYTNSPVAYFIED